MCLDGGWVLDYPICATRFVQPPKRVNPGKPETSNGHLFPAGLTLRARPESYEQLREMAAYWELETTQLAPGRYRGSLEAIYTSRTQLVLADHGCGTRVRGSVPANTVVLSVPLTTTVPTQFRGHRVTGNHLFVQDARHGLDFSFLSPLSIFSLAVQREDLERRATILWNCDHGESFSGLMGFESDAVADRARQVLLSTLRTFIRNPQDLADPDLGSKIERRMLDQLLCALREPLPPENSMARRWIARRAAAMLEVRCREDIDIADVCQAMGASRRTLHLGFMELYGMPPMKYLRALRLSGVRRDLARAGRDPARITAIATAWGFNHLGRFSAYYREFFGELPSVGRAELLDGERTISETKTGIAGGTTNRRRIPVTPH